MVISLAAWAGVSMGTGGLGGSEPGDSVIPPNAAKYASSSARSPILSEEGPVVSIAGDAAVSATVSGGGDGNGSAGNVESTLVEDIGSGGVGKGVPGDPASGRMGGCRGMSGTEGG